MRGYGLDSIMQSSGRFILISLKQSSHSTLIIIRRLNLVFRTRIECDKHRVKIDGQLAGAIFKCNRRHVVSLIFISSSTLTLEDGSTWNIWTPMPRPVHAPRFSKAEYILRHHGVIKYADGPQCTGRQESPQSGRNKAGLGGEKKISAEQEKGRWREKERKDSLEEESQIR